MSRKDKDVKEFGPWSEQTSSSGRKYFYNRDTEVSQWEKPKEWRDHELRLEQERLVAEHQRVQQQQQQQPPVPPPPLFLPPPFPFPPPPPFAPPPGFRPLSTLPPFPPFHPHFQPPPNIPPPPHVLPPRVTTNSATINVSPVASHQSNQIHYASSHHSSATSYSGNHGLAQSHVNNQMNPSGHYRTKQDHGVTHERDRDRPRSEGHNQLHSHSQHIKKEVKENDATKEEERKVVAKQVKRERLSTELFPSVDETPAKKIKEDKQDVEEWRKYYDEELAKKKRIELNLDVDPEMRDLVALSLTLENKLVAELINVKTAAALVAVQENEVRLCNGKIFSLENQRLDLESRQSRFMAPLPLNMSDLNSKP